MNSSVNQTSGRIKYPRTFHMPWSEGISSDDKVVQDMSSFEGQEVVLTLKMDGENTTMYNDYIHARSLDSKHHKSRNWVKNFHSKIRWSIPEGHRIVGENLYAKHSIHYDDLDCYFLGFQVWDGRTCLSYDETLKLFKRLNIKPVKELWRGIYNENKIKEVQSHLNPQKDEGSVLRVTRSFTYDEFRQCVVKQVRAGHVQSDKHWLLQDIVPNKLRDQSTTPS